MATENPIIKELKAIVGTKNLLLAKADLAPHLTDWRGAYTGKAQALVKPESVEEVSRIIALAHEHGTPVIAQGGNTSLCGAATPDNSGEAIILSLTKMNKIRKLDAKGRTITVEAGCILENIQNAASREDLLFPLDIGARGTCQIGGNLSTNAGGLNVVRYGNARALCLGLEVVVADGRIMNLLSSMKKDNTGYDLKNLFIGAEGTLGVITAAVLKLFPKPNMTSTAFVGLRDIDAGISLLNICQAASGGNVMAFELVPDSIISNVMNFHPEIVAPLEHIPPYSVLIEIASTADSDAVPAPDGQLPLDAIMEKMLANALEKGLISDATIAANESQRAALWAIRDLVPESEARAGDTYKSDISIPIEHVPGFYRRAAAAAADIAPGVRVFGFGHIGDGNLHFNLCIPEEGHPDFTALYPQFDVMMLKLIREYGGSISAEHGIGQKKRKMLKDIKDATALDIMQTIKTALDPKGIMTPGKIL